MVLHPVAGAASASQVVTWSIVTYVEPADGDQRANAQISRFVPDTAIWSAPATLATEMIVFVVEGVAAATHWYAGCSEVSCVAVTAAPSGPAAEITAESAV